MDTTHRYFRAEVVAGRVDRSKRFSPGNSTSASLARIVIDCEEMRHAPAAAILIMAGVTRSAVDTFLREGRRRR